MGVRAVRLEVVAGNAVGMSILVDDDLVIGRHADGAGRLADDREISRTHARIVLDGNGFCAIEDLGSTNGTFINGLRISAPQTLSVGDTIELGASTLVVRDLPEADLRSGRPEIAADPAGSLEGPRAPLDDGDRTPSSAQPGHQQPPEVPGQAVENALASVPSLSLRLEFDLGLSEARLYFCGASEPVRLVLQAGVWRFGPAGENQKAGCL